jgi:uncharacterized protein DUF3738
MLRIPAVAGLALSAWQAFAQSAPVSRPQLEVASIKQNKSGDSGAFFSAYPGGRFLGRNVSIQRLMRLAYRVLDFQLSGAPAWLNTERYDIETKAAKDQWFDVIYSMLQSLLEERLQLKYHRETKEEPAYALRAGKYDVDLQFAPDQAQFQAPPSLPPTPLASLNGPSLFTALQKQLGLKLESKKGPVEMFFIDHVERPSDN